MEDRLREIRMIVRSLLLQENRANSFKMIFLAGAPGSGKSTLIEELGLLGFTNCNIDDFFEPALEAHGLSPNLAQLEEDFLAYRALKKSAEQKGEQLDPEDSREYERLLDLRRTEMSLFAQSIKKFKALKQETCQIGSNFIVDGTGSNYKKITKEAEQYREAGYQVAMIMVDIPTDTAVERNRQRGAKGKRQLSDMVVRRSAESVLPNEEGYRQYFQPNFWLVPNHGSFEEYKSEIAKIAPELENFLRG